MFKPIVKKLLWGLAILFFIPGVLFSQPPTEEQILASINLGVPWVAAQQDVNGYWGTSEQVAYTGFALTKLCDYAVERGFSPFDEEYTFHLNVENGFNFIFDKVVTYGAGTGLCATPSALANYYHHETYNAAIALMAIAVSNSPDRVIASANGLVNGKTFKEVQDEMVNYFSWSQMNNSNGGWSYHPTSPTDDNSHTGYVTLALKYAEIHGSVIPASLKSNLGIWIDSIQDDASGGSGYGSPTQWVNLLKTGNLLTEQAFVGYPLADARVQSALNFIQTHWSAVPIPAVFEWGISDPQTMFCLMKGFESYGLNVIFTPGEVNWFDVFATDLVAGQDPAGFWPAEASNWDNNFLNTCWALFILEKIVPNAPPVAVCQNLQLNADENCEAAATAEDVNNGSYDPEGGEITLALSPEGPYGLGETMVTLTVTDDDGATAECTAIITVTDNTPPLLTATTDPLVMLPDKNHEYEQFTLENFGISVSDNCSELVFGDVIITKVTSDEAEDDLGNGDGNTLNDMVIGVDCQSVSLRSERAATGTGRVYTIFLKVEDESGNMAETTVAVLVPHDNSGTEVINEGPVYEVLGDCQTEMAGDAGLKSAGIMPFIPAGYELSNYPNPFSSSTTIRFALPVETTVSIRVYSLTGQEIKTLVHQKYLPGNYSVVFSRPSLTPGNYIYMMKTPEYTLTRKMILMD